MRQVVTARTFGVWKRPVGGEPIATDNYTERLLKYVPVEAVVIWIAIFGSMSAVAYNADFFPLFARWALILGAAGTWLYLQYVEMVHDAVQLVISVIGFIVWVHAFAVLPFSAFSWYNPVLGALLLPAYTALVPLADGLPAWTKRTPV
jgi:hypothetical protein